MSVRRRPTPEELELEKKQAELSILESRLVERELELETLRGGLLSFEKKYQAAMNERYATLDELYARIAEIRAARRPDDAEARRAALAHRGKAEKAAVARARKPEAQSKPRRVAAAKRMPPPAIAKLPEAVPAFDPTDSIKRLYRDVAKALHPDLANDDAERSHRHAFMIRANEAYENSNEQGLADVLHEWHCSPESIRGDGAAAELIRAIRKIARCEQRLVLIAMETDKLQSSGVFGIKMMADEAGKFERDFLLEMTERIDQQIADAKSRLLGMGGSCDRLLESPAEPIADFAEPGPELGED